MSAPCRHEDLQNIILAPTNSKVQLACKHDNGDQVGVGLSLWSDVGHPVERRHPGPLGPELHQVPEIDQEGVPVLLQEWDVTPGVLHLGLEATPYRPGKNRFSKH